MNRLHRRIMAAFAVVAAVFAFAGPASAASTSSAVPYDLGSCTKRASAPYGNVWVQNVSCGFDIRIHVLWNWGPASDCKWVKYRGPAVNFYAPLGPVQRYSTIDYC